MEKNHTHFMKQAFLLAEKGIGLTSPNPMVGAVVVHNNRVVGQAYHKQAGSSHAEVLALQQAKNKTKGATLYVNLEPCCHTGKTPPCTDAIIQSGIREVHYAITDPNPLVSGKGKKTLEKAGITVVVGEMREKAEKLNEAFITFMLKKRPLVIAKFAMSLDGKIATYTGDSKWISGHESRRFVHQLRSTTDAVIVGVETIIKDNPKLTVRLPDYVGKQPFRIILDRHGRTPSKSFVAQNNDGKTIPFKGTLTELMKFLYKQHILSVLVEGGGVVLASFFEQKLIDKIHAFIAPKIVGGQSAKTPVEGDGVSLIKNAFLLQNMTAQKSGEDILITAYTKS